MSPVKWLNHLQFVENLLGIYRNYCSQKRTLKFLIGVHIFVQTLLHTILVIYEVYLLLGREDYSQIKLIFAYFAAFAGFQSMSSTVTGPCFSRDFISFYTSVSGISQYLKADKQSLNSLRKVFCIGITLNIIFLAAAVFRTQQTLIKFLPSYPILNLVPIMVSQVIIRCTVIFENLMLFAVTMIVVHLFRNLTSLISAVQERIGRSDEQCDITRATIQEWVELYRDLVNCCDKVSICFGRQYFFLLVLSLSEYILLPYQILSFSISNKSDCIDSAKIMTIVLSYISMLMMPLIAGQMATNQRVKFHRALARLYNTMIIDSDEAEIKLLKDFIRLMKKNPMEIKLLFKISVGVYMLPVVLSLAVDYVIVMLQFNHVI